MKWDPRKLLGLLKDKNYTKLIFTVIILLLIWVIAPLIPIGGVHPFATVGARFALTGLVLAGFGIWMGIGFVQKYKSQSWKVVSEFASNIWQYVMTYGESGWRYSKERYYDVHDRIKSDRKRRRLKRLPWYLVLGTPQSGKSSLVQNSNLHFQRPEHIGEEAQQYINEFPDFDWWFTRQSILVDVLSNDTEQDVNNWKKFIKLLKRERRDRPFNGILLTLSLPELLTMSNKQRQDFITQLTGYVRDIYSHFKAFVPIYVVFNKCDLVEGFMEFFENLSKEELDQVWGMTFPIEGSNDLQQVMNSFNREYILLVQQLRKRVMWAFDSEKTMRGRELINAFPQQMNLFRKPIEGLIAEIFGATRYQQAVQLRGIYFTSCAQGQGLPQDFLLQAMSKKFQLVPPQLQRSKRIGESYFVRGLFYEVFLPEADFLGRSERRKKLRTLFYRLALIGSPIALIVLGIFMHGGLEANKQNVKAINGYIHAYHKAEDAISSGNPSITDTLPALTQLQHAKMLYTQSNNVGLHILFTSHYIKDTIKAAQQRALHSLFLPRIAAGLEKSLKGNINDQNILYADLKGYLAYSAASYTNKYALSSPMEYQWDREFAVHPETAKQLKYYLNVALRNPIDKLPLDNDLIGRIRSQLAEVNPAQRAYGLLSLRANVGDDSDIYIASAAGNDFAKVFSLTKKKVKIPSLYTKRAFNNVFLKQYRSIAEEVAEDNHDIGLSSANDASSTKSSLVNSLQNTYNQRYISTWQTALGEINVKPFTSLNDSVNVMDILISNNSPLSQLLSMVYDNTSGVANDGVNVETSFKDINSYTENAGWGTSWHDTAKVLTKLRDYLVKLQQSQDQNKASFDVAKAVISGKAENPMKQLTDIASKSPELAKRWLMALANNCWQIIIRGAHDHMNTAWRETIVPTYNEGMRGRFPLTSTLGSSVSMNAFNQLMGYGGALDKYFIQYVKPFVNTESQNWKLYSQHGLTIEIPKSHIEAFKRANVIRQEFFPSGSNKASLEMTIKPLTLDKRATSVEFVVGPQTIRYSHGPQMETSVTWPMPFNSQNSRIVITTFNSDQYAHSSGGAWSLFRMFKHGVFKQGATDGSYQFDLNFRGHTASFAISGPSNINIFTLKDIQGFSLPEVFAPTASTPHKEKK